MRWRGAEASSRRVLSLVAAALVLTAAGGTVREQGGDVRVDRPWAERSRGRVGPPAPQPGAWAGIAAGSAILQEDDASLGRHLDGIAATGARWLRVDLYWGVIEPSPGAHDWRAPDAVIAGAEARGLSVLAVAGYTPGWARPDGTSDKQPPDDPAAFGRFLAAATARYGETVRVWEIWNEPNVSDFWAPAPDPAAYTALLRAAAAGIRGVDPTATVLLGGLAPSDDASAAGIAPATFLEAVYEAGGGDAFDGVAVHPYSWPASPLDSETTEWNAFQAVPGLRGVMEAHGDAGKRIWGTELGFPTGDHERAVDEDAQLRFLQEAYAAWLSWPWTGPLLVYQYRDTGTDAGDPEDNFGLVRRDFSTKAAGRGFAAVVTSTICAPGEGRPGCRPAPGVPAVGRR